MIYPTRQVDLVVSGKQQKSALKMLVEILSFLTPIVMPREDVLPSYL